MKEIIIKTIPIYNGRIIKLERNLVKLPNNNLAFREVAHHQQGVCIIPLIDDKIIFVKQFRSGINQTLIELPAGIVDQNELPHDAALRELQEEISYTSSSLLYLGSYFSSPGFCDEEVHLYLANNLSYKFLNHDEDEFIETIKYHQNKVKELLDKHYFKDMKTSLALSIFFNIINN